MMGSSKKATMKKSTMKRIHKNDRLTEAVHLGRAD